MYIFRSLDNNFWTLFISHSASIQMRDKTQDLFLNPSLSLRSKFIVPYRNVSSSINSSGRQKYSFSQVLTTVSHSRKLFHESHKVLGFYKNSSSYSHSCQSVVLNYEKNATPWTHDTDIRNCVRHSFPWLKKPSRPLRLLRNLPLGPAVEDFTPAKFLRAFKAI